MKKPQDAGSIRGSPSAYPLYMASEPGSELSGGGPNHGAGMVSTENFTGTRDWTPVWNIRRRGRRISCRFSCAVLRVACSRTNSAEQHGLAMSLLLHPMVRRRQIQSESFEELRHLQYFRKLNVACVGA